MNLENQKIAVVGLGYVGLPRAVEFGKARPVLGFDVNDARWRIARWQGQRARDACAGSASGLVPRIQQRSQQTRRMRYFHCYRPNTIDSANRPDSTPVIRASETVGKAMRAGAVVIYESTVYPGCTEEVCVTILERESGLRFGDGFFCGYSPGRINPGDRVNMLTTIKKITSGSTVEAAEAVDALYRGITRAGTWKSEGRGGDEGHRERPARP